MSRSPDRPTTGWRSVALVVAAAMFVVSLDGAIISTSLPQMAQSFGVTPVDVNVGIVAYLLSVAAFIPLSAWVTNRFGARTVFAAAIAVFALASVACGVATSLPVFIAARVGQGIGGALIMPLARVLVLQRAEKHEIMQATALTVWPALLAPIVGPVLGGAITTYLDWRWNFLLNAPLGILGLLLILVFVPKDKPGPRRPLDLLGALLASSSLLMAMYALEQLAGSSPPLQALALLAGAGLLGGSAVLWFRRTEHPLLDLSPFRIQTFAVTMLDAGSLQRIAMSATPFLLPLMLQVVWNLTPLETGGVLFLYFCGNLGIKPLTTLILRWLGFKTVLVGNGILVAMSVAACGFLSPETGQALAGAVVVLAGAARSLQFTALNTLGFADVSGDQRASAATLSAMMQQIGMALGVSVGAVFLHLSQALGHGSSPGAEDFRAAFLAVALCSVVGAVMALRLRTDAGWEVSGRAPRTSATE